MHTLLRLCRQKRSGFAYALSSGILVLGLALAAPAAGMSAGGGGGGAGGGGAGAGAGGGGSAGGGGTTHRPNGQTELACPRGMVWDDKDQKCLARHSGVLTGPGRTEYAVALAKPPSDERLGLR
jgi:hypothetical protein